MTGTKPLPEKILPLILASFGAFVLLLQLYLFSGSFADDAFISFLYAENLAEGRGLVFNPGERVEGFSNFLWVILLSGVHAAGGEIPVAAKAIGLFSLLSVLGGSFLAIRDWTGSPVWAAAVLPVLGSHFSWVFFAWTGMETGLYAACLFWGCWWFSRGQGRLSPRITVAALAASLLRPEGVLFLPLLIGYAVWREGRLPKSAWKHAAVFGALYGSFLIWRLQYFGSILPNTFFAKPMRISERFPPVVSGFDDIFRFVVGTGGPYLLGFVCVALASARTRTRAAPFLPGLLVPLLFHLYAGGDWMENYRFLVPMVPLYLTLGLFGVWWLLDRVSWRPHWTMVLSACALLSGVHLGEGVRFYLARGSYPNFVMTSETLVPAAKWIGARFPSEFRVACPRIGALGYYSRLYVIDTLGLTDKAVAEMRFRGEWDEDSVERYLGTRNPELILRSGSRVAAIQESILVAGKEYRFVRALPLGTKESWLLYARADVAGREGLS